MKIRIRFFGIYRDLLNTDSVEREYPANKTIENLFDEILAAHPRKEDLKKVTQFAKNLNFVPKDSPVSDGDEVAFMPPMSGG